MSEKEMEESVRSMVVEIQESLDRLKDSIDALPDDDMGYDAPVLVEAIEKNVELEKRLKDAVMVAEDHVKRVECVYGSIVDSLLLSSSSSSAAAASSSSSSSSSCVSPSCFASSSSCVCVCVCVLSVCLCVCA